MLSWDPLLTIKESFRPDEAGISHRRTYKSSLQEPGGAPTGGHSPQEHNQAENRLALDQGTDPRWLVHRNPEEEVEGAGKDEGDQPPADLWVLQERETAQPPTLSPVLGEGVTARHGRKSLIPVLWRWKHAAVEIKPGLGYTVGTYFNSCPPHHPHVRTRVSRLNFLD